VKILERIRTLFFYLLILLLPTQLGLHFWPQWATVLGRRIDYLSPTLYVTDVLIGCILLSWIIEKVYGDWYLVFRTKKKFVFPQILNTKTVILSIFVITNILVAISRPVALYSWIKFFEFFLLGAYIVKTKPRFERIVLFLSLSVVYSSIIAIAQFLLQHSVGGVFWWLGERTFSAATPGIAQIPLCLPWSAGCPLLLRAYATFSHPNVLGGYIATILPLVIIQYTNKRTRPLRLSASSGGQVNKSLRIQKYLYLGTVVAGFIAIVLTFSRSAWAVGALGIGITYWVLRKKQHMLPPIIHASYPLILAFLCIAFVASLVIPQFLGDSESIVVRQQLNTSALFMIQRSPLIGVGLGNFLVKLPETLPSRMIYFLQPVHNIYLLIVSEIGLIGCGVFGWLLFLTIKNHGERIKNQGRKLFIQKIIIRNSLFMILLIGFIDHYPLTLQQGQMLLTLFVSLVLQ
jgi:O-antigen ligase